MSTNNQDKRPYASMIYGFESKDLPLKPTEPRRSVASTSSKAATVGDHPEYQEGPANASGVQQKDGASDGVQPEQLNKEIADNTGS